MRALGALLVVIVVAAVAAVVIRSQSNKSKEATVALPDRTYSAAIFDTVTWDNEQAAIARGKEVFGWVCAKCHGVGGLGDGGEVIEGDTIHPPSFVAPEWRFANDEAGLRQRIYLGNNRGMPHWGEQGLQPRDIAAVASYIRLELRKN